MKLLIVFFFVFITTYGSTLENNRKLFCNSEVSVGASRISDYIDLIKGKKVGVVGNQSSMLGEIHLVDSLLKLDINVLKVFSPEHGFRGKADAGEKVVSGIDNKTGLPIVSLYGNNKKPRPDQINDIDVLIFDIQDVGARFYTYISTLHYVMEACAENDIKLIVLDRPNPNGHYVDGPVLEMEFKSFVGKHPIPVVHGMTIGEYANMINGEGWLSNKLICDLKVVKIQGWNHQKFYQLPIKPSPNLPNMLSVYLYPSLCFFEGTVVSIGRGTDSPFQVIGHPLFPNSEYWFKPISKEGAKSPKLMNKKSFGIDFTNMGINVIQNQKKIQLQWLLLMYKELNMGKTFFLKNNFINLLAGSGRFQQQIIAGKTENEIRQSWEPKLSEFKVKRKKYLLYEDFN